jgi:TRAP-type C4-dicarboxylate transport system permease small subunit
VLNDAPRWTEEAARFGMLWMTGLMAPVAYRQGGFVAIVMVERALPRIAAGILTLVLLSLSLWVLCIMWDRGLNNHVVSLSGRGTMPSMRLPLDWFGGESIKFKNQWMFASLFVGVTLLILVNIELILRQIITLLGGAARLTPLGDQTVMAE